MFRMALATNLRAMLQHSRVYSAAGDQVRKLSRRTVVEYGPDWSNIHVATAPTQVRNQSSLVDIVGLHKKTVILDLINQRG